MRAIPTSLKSSPRSCTSLSTALLFALAAGLSGIAATAQAPASAFQNVLVTQVTELGSVSTGGGESGQVPAGDTMAVNSAGTVFMGNTYGGNVLAYPAAGGGPVTLGSPGNNPAGMAVDSQNNLYVAMATYTSVIKVPYVSGAYVALTAPSGSTPNCTGTDTVECVMSNVNTDGSGVIGLTFDSKGDLFYTTSNIANDGSGTAPNSIWECSAACLYATATPSTAVLLFTEPTSTTASTTGQLNVGGLALDPYGNLFFTDSAVWYEPPVNGTTPTTDNQESFSSNLNELAASTTTSTGFAATPTVIYNYTPSSASNYDAEINGVVTDASGTVYALVQNTIGLLAFPNSNGTINTSKMYLASTETGKLLAVDSTGNFYIDAYISGDAIVRVGVNNLVATPSASGVASSATNLTTILNDGGCSPTPTVTFTLAASPSPFTVATSGGCSTSTVALAGGSNLTSATFATTLNFTPPGVGTSTDTVTATDSLNNAATASVTGLGTGTVATPVLSLTAGTYTGSQQLTITDATVGASIYYTTDGSTPGANTGTSTLYSGAVTISASETVSAIAVDPGDASSTVATAAYVINIAGAIATPVFSTAGGTFTTPQAVSLTDSTAGALIYYTTDGSAPSTTSTLYTSPIDVAATETINAIAAGGGAPNSGVATALFTITLPASAFQNIVLNQQTTLGMLPGGGSLAGSVPAGDSMAVTSFGEVITTDTYGGAISGFSTQGAASSTVGSISNPNGVAVDAQNNLYIGLSYSSQVVKLPYVNGMYAALAATSGTTPNCTGMDTVECVMSNLTTGGANVVSLVFDSKGDLFYSTGPASPGAGTNNAIFECTAACLYTGTPAASLIFQEPPGSAPATTGQLNIGGLALDSAGDLFFTDSAVSSATSEESFGSNVNEIPISSTTSTGYAATPTVIYAYTPTVPAQYGAEIDGIAVALNGTVYALNQGNQGSQAGNPAPGILAFPLSSTGYSSTTMYLASTQNGKLMTSDALGNLYIADDGGNIDEIAVDNLTAPTAPVQNPATATNITTILNDGGCTATPPTVTFAATGTSAAAFTAAVTAPGTCTATAVTGTTNAASFATTLTFNPISVGSNTATLTATDSLSNTGAAVVSGQGTPAPPAATPTFSVPGGSYATVQTVAITDTTTGAMIYYTTDGSTPAAGAGTTLAYTTPINVTTDETINAIATASGFSSSPVATAVYDVVLPVAATPTFSVAAGTYTTPQTVSITDTTPGVSIYFTIDGSMPGAGTGTSVLYTAPITVGVTETINAIAVPSTPTTSFASSSVATALYTINLPAVATPTFSVAAGTFTTVQTVSLSDATAGATIYYTIDGSTPSIASTPYTTPITVAVSTTINAIAVDANYNNSAVATAAYVISLPATAFTITGPTDPTVTVVGGTGSISLTITANAAFNGSISFACSGFLPVGATCTFSPTSVTLAALANTTTKLTVTVPKATAALHGGPNPLLPGTMAAAALCLLGFRKRRRLRMLLMLVIGVAGLSMFSGCTTTSTTSTSSSQMVVTATGSSLPVNAPSTTNSTPVSASFPLVLTIQ